MIGSVSERMREMDAGDLILGSSRMVFEAK